LTNKLEKTGANCIALINIQNCDGIDCQVSKPGILKAINNETNEEVMYDVHQSNIGKEKAPDTSM